MKLFTALALAALSPIVLAQNGPPPQRGGMARQSNTVSAPSTKMATNRAVSQESETIRILRLKAVQVDLGLSQTELQELSSIALSLSRTSATEEIAYTAVSQALTAAQATRLQQLLVQDLGYNALALSDVREQLFLQDSQSAQIASLVSTLEAAKSALASSLDVASAASAKTSLLAKAGAKLAKVLTADQDKKLRSLAGRSLANS